MLPQHNRLKRANEIETVFRRGQAFHSPFFSVKFMPGAKNPETRVAFSFGRKYLIRAVDRNRLKRIIIRELREAPGFFSSGLDMVFFLNKPVSLDNKASLQGDISDFLKKLPNQPS